MTQASAARQVESSSLVRLLARGGYAADGLVHTLVGALVVTLAFGGRGDADQAGALRAIAGAPLGLVVLWAIAVLLAGLALYQLLSGILVRSPQGARSAAKAWGRRISAWGQSVVFAAMGVLAASVAVGARPNGNRAAEGASRGALSLPGGGLVLALVGLGIAIGGVAFVVMGVRRSFVRSMSIPANGLGRFVTGLGVVGYAAKGVALAVVGSLLLVAAVRADPAQAGGLDDAFDSLRAVALGPLLVGVVGAGFVAYGVFLFFRARFARL